MSHLLARIAALFRRVDVQTLPGSSSTRKTRDTTREFIPAGEREAAYPADPFPRENSNTANADTRDSERPDLAAMLAHLRDARLEEEENSSSRRMASTQARQASRMESCEMLTDRHAPEYQFDFRLPFELVRLLDLPLPNFNPPLSVSCVPILAGRLSIAVDLRYAQIWAFQRLCIADLASSIALAPSEKLTLTIKKTQRTQLTESTLQSSESLDSTESSIVDKDVLNIQRSTANTMQWRVDGSASVSLLGIFNLGGGGGIAGSSQSSSNTVIEQISEATEKSVRRVQALQKIEVARQSELTLDESQTRVIENPYHDRSLTLHVYELAKQFSVSTALAEIRPVMILEITNLDLTRDFVLAQGEFLDAELLDRSLAAELKEALAAVREPVGTSHRILARRYARLAFHFLFEAPNIFNLDNSNAAENDPWLSFDDDEGFEDACANQAGRMFMILGTFLRLQAEIYRQPPFVPPAPPLSQFPPNWMGPSRQGHDLEVEIAVALADALRDEWKALPPEAIEDLTDTGDRSEILRRVPGFLSMVDGLLKPLLKPLEEERAAAEARNRAEDVIDRVERHLGCNKAFYTQRFLDNMWRRTHGYTLGDTYCRAIRSGQVPGLLANQIEEFLQTFNPRLGFLDGFQFVVPLHHAVGVNAGLAFIENMTGTPNSSPGSSGPLGHLHLPIDSFRTDVRDLTIPADGFHLEPIGGSCVLRDVPNSGSSVSTNISIQATET